MPPPNADKPNRRILIVDDDQTIHGAFHDILDDRRAIGSSLDEAEAALFGEAQVGTSGYAFELDSAFQGQEALERVIRVKDTAPYAMAFVDMRMPPGWDGVETIRRVWEVDPELQIVICSAHNDYSWDQIRELLGESDQLLILKKPFDTIEVRQLTTALTAKWNLSREVKRRLAELDAAVEERTQALQSQQSKLEKTHTQLLHAQRLESIGQLAAGIAHEINTPVQFIGDNIRFLSDGFRDLIKILERYTQILAPSEGRLSWQERRQEIETLSDELDIDFFLAEVPKAIEQATDGVNRVATIVRSMKEFSHPDREEKYPADLNRAIEATITVARNEWKYIADIQTDLDPSLPDVTCVLGDINQVVLNLIINAAHAIADTRQDDSDSKGSIEIRTRHDDDNAVIQVCDTGIGIPEEIRTRIFDPFFTTKEVGKGTGQGLAIAHTVIVDKHNGSITCESTVGAGTTFTVCLPISPSDTDLDHALPNASCEGVS